MNKGKFVLTKNMLTYANKTVKKLLSKVNILEVHTYRDTIEYLAECEEFEDSYILTIPEYEIVFNTTTCDMRFIRKQLSE